ncbi:hypothetical protein Hanom_Chr10g00963211 [Helianthus anomalus]
MTVAHVWLFKLRLKRVACRAAPLRLPVHEKGLQCGVLGSL